MPCISGIRGGRKCRNFRRWVVCLCVCSVSRWTTGSLSGLFSMFGCVSVWHTSNTTLGTQLIHFLNHTVDNSGRCWYTRSRHLGTQLVRPRSHYHCVLSVMWHTMFHAFGKRKIKLSWLLCLGVRLILSIFYVRYKVKRCAGIVGADWLRPWMHVRVFTAFVTATVKNSLMACTLCVCPSVRMCTSGTVERIFINSDREIFC
jgi:hypothetical protein